MSSPDMHRPESRYGADRTPKKPSGIGGKVVVLGAIILLILAVIVAARYINNRQEVSVSAEMASFERVDDETIQLWIDVTRENPEEPAYCIVTAIDYAMAEVGRRELLLPAGGEQVSRHEVFVTARDLPVSGSVYGCSTVIPNYMDL